ncbi:hypothetical protein [Sphingomonas sp.]|uniref:hypothetical protein n=1 Tax=Sphingomonas sp. TaxID=28214 RepID=UPI001AFD0C08|nr:hypothetical protein [Sphingomonas sp.]MBO9715219.1 hypothetical protein [Sphingomonas sp.]
MRLAVLGWVLAAAGGVPGAIAQDAPEAEGITAWEGTCSADSMLSRPGEAEAAYGCNGMIRMVFPEPGHEQLIFLRKGDNESLVAFGGNLDAAGDLVLTNVQFRPVKATLVDGRCAIRREGGVPRHIRCEAKASDGSGGAARIDFAVDKQIDLKN